MSGLLDGLTTDARVLWMRVKQLFPNARMTSGARSRSHNSGIPGASNTSQHIGGNAFDFVVPGMDPLQVQATIAKDLGIPFGQSIAEYGLGMGPRNHLSVPGSNPGQLLTARNGRYTVTGRVPLNMGAGAGRDALRNILGDDWGNWMADGLGEGGLGGALTAPAEALESLAPDWDSWFKRGALVIFALIFIAAALFSFKPVREAVGAAIPG
jgi:hypothetical protein